MAESINLSRNKLAEFIKDPQSIRQFERLFQIVNAVAPNISSITNTSSGSSDSKSDLALSLLDSLSQAVYALALAPVQEPFNDDLYMGSDPVYIPPYVPEPITEHGTFTATLKASVTDPTTPITTTGHYVKIGRQVTYNIDFANVDTTGSAGNIKITGLPFSSAYRSFGSSVKSGLGSVPDVPMIGSPANVIQMIEIVTATESAIVAGAGKYLFVQITTYI